MSTPIARRAVLRSALLTAVVAASTTTTGCSVFDRPGPDVERHPLPRLPELGSVSLPTGFVFYGVADGPYGPRSTVEGDSAFFEFGGGGFFTHRNRAQVAVSRFDPRFTTPQAHVDQLGTKLADSEWFVTSFDPGWRQSDPTQPNRWTLEIPAEYGRNNAVAVLRFVPTRGLVLGLWAFTDVYALPEAVAVAEWAVSSIG